MNKAYLVTWLETERGWGQRPDGCSIHLSKENYESYLEEYWSELPKEVPDEYSRPDSGLREIVLSDDLYKKLQESKDGIRLWQGEFREKKEKNEILFKN